MTDGDHYAAYADVQYLLMNAGLGVAGNTLFDANAIDLGLSITLAILHGYMGLTTLTKLTQAVQAVILKGIQIDMITMMILRARALNENNISAFGETTQFWQITPYLTQAHKQMLDKMIDQNEGVAWTFNTVTGTEV